MGLKIIKAILMQLRANLGEVGQPIEASLEIQINKTRGSLIINVIFVPYLVMGLNYAKGTLTRSLGKKNVKSVKDIMFLNVELDRKSKVLLMLLK